MSPEKQRVAIAELCGVQPELVGYDCVSPDGTSIVMSAEREGQCFEWLQKMPSTSPYKKYTVKPYYRYPRYDEDLNAMQHAEMWLHAKAKAKGATATDIGNWMKYSECVYLEFGIMATAKQRAEALLRACNKWENL